MFILSFYVFMLIYAYLFSIAFQLDLQSFDSGAYFIKLIVNNQIAYTDRIFKQ